MKANVGDFDGWLRILLFIVAICYAILAGGYAWLWVIPATVLFATAVLMWCPLFEMFGINMNKEKTNNH